MNDVDTTIFMGDTIQTLKCVKPSISNGESGGLFSVLSSPVVRIGNSYCVFS